MAPHLQGVIELNRQIAVFFNDGVRATNVLCMMHAAMCAAECEATAAGGAKDAKGRWPLGPHTLALCAPIALQVSRSTY